MGGTKRTDCLQNVKRERTTTERRELSHTQPGAAGRGDTREHTVTARSWSMSPVSPSAAAIRAAHPTGQGHHLCAWGRPGRGRDGGPERVEAREAGRRKATEEATTARHERATGADPARPEGRRGRRPRRTDSPNPKPHSKTRWPSPRGHGGADPRKHGRLRPEATQTPSAQNEPHSTAPRMRKIRHRRPKRFHVLQ